MEVFKAILVSLDLRIRGASLVGWKDFSSFAGRRHQACVGEDRGEEAEWESQAGKDQYSVPSGHKTVVKSQWDSLCQWNIY